MFDLNLSIRVLSLEMISSPHPGGADDLRNGPLWATPRMGIAAVVRGNCMSTVKGSRGDVFYLSCVLQCIY